jgi:DNA recombination protein RmuC
MQEFLMTIEPMSLLLGFILGLIGVGVLFYFMQVKVEKLYGVLAQLQADKRALEVALEKEELSSKEKLILLQSNKEQMLFQFQELSQRISDVQSQKFVMTNSQEMNKIVAPFKEQIEQFKKQVNDVYLNETKERSMLKQELHHLKELHQRMSQETKNLTQALKGESKTQGIWGEMILEKVLESSGLRLGHEYDREVTLKSADGSRLYRPDVLVHLPDKRDIIIDAKTSLSSYERYMSDDDNRARHLEEHIDSLNYHVKRLSDKNYTKLQGITTLDFIFMFVPIESALMLAMEHDQGLYERAFKKNILLVGPSTLMVALRSVENTWRYEHQQKNAQKIAHRAGALYDKFVGFVVDMQKLGEQLKTVEKSYDAAYNKLHDGKGSLTSQLHKLKEMGASTSKSLPDEVLKRIDD